MISLIQAVFENKLIEDDRIPLFTFDLAGHTLGFFLMDLLFWVQILTTLVLVGIFACIMWAMTYYIVIPNRGTPTSYLIGFGVIIPLMTMYPLWLLHALDIRNKLVRFSTGAMYPIITVFHSIEAMYGFSPNNVEESFSHYALYNACILDIEYEICPKTDKKRPIKITAQDIITPVVVFVKYLFITGIYLSAFGPLFEPYETDANGNEPSYDPTHLLDFNLFRNSATCAIFYQLTISTFTIGVSILANTLFGVKTKNAMQNPMFEATSPSDFWGNRWNLIIHGALKRGIFKPVYKYSSKTLAILATFLASGAFHEYLLLVIFHEDDNVNVAFGKNTSFMMWNAGIITIESFIGSMFVFQWMKKTLPKPLLTFLILSTALPIAHWFIHPYTKNGFFEDIIIGFCMIKKV